MFTRLVFFFFPLVVAAMGSVEKKSASVTFNSETGKFVVKDTYDTNADAYGYYYINYNESFWNYLDANMQSEVTSVNDHLTYSKSLGYLEGYMTCETIKTFYPNFYSAMFGDDTPGNETLAFLKSNYDWLNTMSDKYASTDNYWYSVKATLQQLNGLYEGYQAGCPNSNKNVESWSTFDSSSLEKFLLINAWGDLYQITLKYRENGQNARMFGNRLYSGVYSKRTMVERCSAIIKLLADKSDVVFGHGTWDSYESLGPRIFKHYSFPLMRNGFAEHHYDVYFSSSPGVLSSIDDFFVMSGYGEMTVIETTNSLYDLKLLDKVVPETVLSWTRAVVSNQLASNGTEWAETFARYHSGTYTNQWMAIDLKKFVPGNLPEPGFLTVFEEVPGLVHYEDKTDVLNGQFFWPSYNIPYYKDIYRASGNERACERESTNCYETAPRAQLFAAYQSNVTDLSGGEWILGYNNFQTDPQSLDDSCNAIACRGDLEADVKSRGAFGALDVKVTSALNAKRNPGDLPLIRARLGPTHDEQPVFCWDQVKDEALYSHQGQPNCFGFEFVTLPPRN